MITLGRLFDLDPCRRWHGRLTAYIIREHERGRPLAEILDDRFVVEHASAAAITHLLEHPQLIHRLTQDCLRPLAAAQETVAGVQASHAVSDSDELGIN